MPVTGLTRELSLTYNSFQVGGSTARPIHGFTVQEMSKDVAAVMFDVIVTADTEANFASACSAIEAAYRVPYKDLTVTLGGTNLIAVTQSGNTGLDAIASIDKPGGPPDSGRSRRYRVRIEYGLPATWASTVGLRDSAVIIERTPAGRVQVRLTGVFTAITSNDALAQHDSQISTWAAAQLTWLGISTYELVQETRNEVSINRKTMRFERVYRELIYSQAGSSNDSAIREQVLIITRARRGSEYSPQDSDGYAVSVTPLQDVNVQYSCWINKAVTQDLVSKWESIEEWVIGEVAAAVGSGTFGLLSAAPSYNFDENRIDAVVTGVATDPTGSDLVQNVVETVFVMDPGYEILPIWDGNPESAFVFQGMQTYTKTVTRRWRTLEVPLGASGSGSFQGGGGAAGGGVQGVSAPVAAPVAGGAGNVGNEWLVLSETHGNRPVMLGKPGNEIRMTEQWRTTVSRRINRVD